VDTRTRRDRHGFPRLRLPSPSSCMASRPETSPALSSRNRLLTSSSAGVTTSYNYDPYGRLDTMTANGTVLQRQIYDGFDHVVESRSTSGGTTKTTKYTPST
jgi:YD repeat-containing protein